MNVSLKIRKSAKADSVLSSPCFLEKMMKKALVALLLLLLAGCSDEQAARTETAAGDKSAASIESLTAPPAPAQTEAVVPPTPVPATQQPRVLIETTMGDISLELFPEKSPKTVENFLQYVDEGFYDGSIFHRVIDGFMIQGGGFDQDYNRRETRDAVLNEADNGLRNERGTIAMARTGDPHSATAQFFINHSDNPALDHRNKGAGWGYAVFGKVIDGMDVVDAIATTQTGPGGPFGQDAPREMVVIKQISLLTD
jgi:peptidyl-prolyl cis-trans isomerase B (cyclophilin B)